MSQRNGEMSHLGVGKMSQSGGRQWIDDTIGNGRDPGFVDGPHQPAVWGDVRWSATKQTDGSPFPRVSRPAGFSKVASTTRPPVRKGTEVRLEDGRRVLSERVVEHHVRMPRRVLREDFVERVVIIPEKRRREELIEETTRFRETVVEIARPVVKERIVEVPEIEWREKIVEVPTRIRQEKIREVPQIEYRDRIVEVPKLIPIEKIVEVPVPEYREVPIERIVELPEVRETVQWVDVPVPRYVDVPVREDREVIIPRDVRRQIPVPVESIQEQHFTLPQIRAHHTRIDYPVYVPRFVEVAVPHDPDETRDDLHEALELSNRIRGFVGGEGAPSITEIERLAAEVRAHPVHDVRGYGSAVSPEHARGFDFSPVKGPPHFPDGQGRLESAAVDSTMSTTAAAMPDEALTARGCLQSISRGVENGCCVTEEVEILVPASPLPEHALCAAGLARGGRSGGDLLPDYRGDVVDAGFDADDDDECWESHRGQGGEEMEVTCLGEAYRDCGDSLVPGRNGYLDSALPASGDSLLSFALDGGRGGPSFDGAHGPFSLSLAAGPRGVCVPRGESLQDAGEMLPPAQLGSGQAAAPESTLR